MSNKNPKNQFQKGTTVHALRRNAGRKPRTPAIAPLAADQTFRYVFRNYIRGKSVADILEDVDTDLIIDRSLKQFARDLISESTTLQARVGLFNYIEPIPKSELEGTPNESLPAEQKELVEKISMLNLEGLRKIAAILEEEKYITTDEHV